MDRHDGGQAAQGPQQRVPGRLGELQPGPAHYLRHAEVTVLEARHPQPVGPIRGEGEGHRRVRVGEGGDAQLVPLPGVPHREAWLVLEHLDPLPRAGSDQERVSGQGEDRLGHVQEVFGAVEVARLADRRRDAVVLVRQAQDRVRLAVKAPQGDVPALAPAPLLERLLHGRHGQGTDPAPGDVPIDLPDQAPVRARPGTLGRAADPLQLGEGALPFVPLLEKRSQRIGQPGPFTLSPVDLQQFPPEVVQPQVAQEAGHRPRGLGQGAVVLHGKGPVGEEQGEERYRAPGVPRILDVRRVQERVIVLVGPLPAEGQGPPQQGQDHLHAALGPFVGLFDIGGDLLPRLPRLEEEHRIEDGRPGHEGGRTLAREPAEHLQAGLVDRGRLRLVAALGEGDEGPEGVGIGVLLSREHGLGLLRPPVHEQALGEAEPHPRGDLPPPAVGEEGVRHPAVDLRFPHRIAEEPEKHVLADRGLQPHQKVRVQRVRHDVRQGVAGVVRPVAIPHAPVFSTCEALIAFDIALVDGVPVGAVKAGQGGYVEMAGILAGKAHRLVDGPVEGPELPEGPGLPGEGLGQQAVEVPVHRVPNRNGIGQLRVPPPLQEGENGDLGAPLNLLGRVNGGRVEALHQIAHGNGDVEHGQKAAELPFQVRKGPVGRQQPGAFFLVEHAQHPLSEKSRGVSAAFGLLL